VDFPTWDDLFRIARDEALARNAKLTRAVIERAGTDTNVMVATGAATGEEVVGQLAEVEASLFLDSAEGRKLDRLVFDRYSLTRKPASQALTSVQFRTTNPAPGAFAIPRGTKLSTPDGREFLTWVAANYPMGGTGPVTVEVRSVLSGADQQVRTGAITSLVTPLTGQPTDLTVSNPVASTGADDEESDEALRDRARRFFTTARRGTLGAVEAGALVVPGVRTAEAFESVDTLGRPARGVELVISDAFTEALVDSNPTSYQTQSQTLAQVVLAALDDVRAAGIYVQVTVGIVRLQGITLGLRFDAGADVDLAALNARGAVVAYVNGLPPGAPLLVASIIDQLRPIPGLVVTGAEVLSPAGDVIASPLEVIRTALALVVASSLQPDRALQGSTNPDAPNYP